MSQPPPTPNTGPSMHDLVGDYIRRHADGAASNYKLLDDLEKRKMHGIDTYGCLLQPFNGRDALLDAYEEQLDNLVYLRQALYEAEDAPHPDPNFLEELQTTFRHSLSITGWTARALDARTERTP